MRALVECFFMDEEFVHAFCKVPAGIRNHHAYLGGLLEHVTTLLDGADRLLPLYPELDRDLVLMGIFLHDIGKVRELSWRANFFLHRRRASFWAISVSAWKCSAKRWPRFPS